MQKYINQLLQDLQRTTFLREKVYDAQNEQEEELDFQDYIKDVERFIHEIPIHNMYDHFDFSKEVFPPEEKLNDGQIESLVDALQSLWSVHRFECAYPDEAPKRMIYPLLLKVMAEPTSLHKYGVSHIELCGYYPPECPMKEYCTCKDLWDELDDEIVDSSLGVD